MVGFSAQRELPIVGKIAAGSLRNKLLVLLPTALVLSYFLPWAITPLLMFGGAYLCYEGAEKIFETVVPYHAHLHEAQLGTIAWKPQTLEDEKVASAIKTDFILSAEIMAITLAAVPEGSILTQALVLALVGVGITVAVYGVVALIVKADDVGLALAKSEKISAIGGLIRTLGCALFLGMPVFLKVLSAVGTAAMIWVGGILAAASLIKVSLPTNSACAPIKAAMPCRLARFWDMETGLKGRPPCPQGRLGNYRLAAVAAKANALYFDS